MAAGGMGLLAAGAAGAFPAIAGPFEAGDVADHFIPLDKKLRPEWLESLFAKGDRAWYGGDDLATIGMPIGGIGAGQLYLTGDGRLVYWGIFNRDINSGYGQINYKEKRTPTEMVVNVNQFTAAPQVEQGVAVRVKWRGQTVVRALDRQGFPAVRFCGEYPLAYVKYEADDLPLAVELEAFSPFIPLNADDSALPATLLSYSLKNVSDEHVEVTLAGWLQNGTLYDHTEIFTGAAVHTNEILREPAATHLLCSVRPSAAAPAETRDPIVLADFEGPDYGDWQVEGEAFGSGPARGTLDRQQRVSGFMGKGLVNTYLGGSDQKQGRLLSPVFTIERPYLSFLIGGGGYADETCIRLLVDGKPVRNATGTNNERLRPQNWNVRDLQGKQAQIEIVDAHSGPWGHINVDQIELRDTPRTGGVERLELQPDFGTLSLSLLAGEGVSAAASVGSGPLPETLYKEEGLNAAPHAEAPLDEPLRGAIGATFTLEPGASRTLTFVVAWCMPNRYYREQRSGNCYATRFANAAEVVRYVAANIARLTDQTRLWHDTYYDATLPHWLLDRIHSTVANLATNTCQWFGNRRFWAYEGVGCCHGTCGHVWNYAHAAARLFPELERSVREMQDFAPGVGFIPETGEIRFRGEDWGLWAGDSQGGYILKAYREHQTSRDDQFLRRNWPQIKKAVEFLIEQDGNADGLLEGRQHQTYDQDYYGANTMVGSLYLGALRAAEEMARELKDAEFAERCRAVFEAGSRNSVQRLFNGEYFIQQVDLQKHPDWQYADGCLADQLFGQGWAHQVGLGYLYPAETVLQALDAIWRYCWAPDIKLQNERHPPERWFAYAGEAGLFTCTWPKSKHLGPKSTRYRDEIWTGIEYQVANHLAYEGKLTEALAMCRAVHDRYHPSKRNPFNEIECGDHYARALASWGVLISLAGFEYHGPKRHFGFAPRITPDAFRCVFTAAAGWGTIAQRRQGTKQVNRIEVRYGEAAIDTIKLALPDQRPFQRLTVNGESLEATVERLDNSILIKFAATRTITPDAPLEIEIEM